MKKKRKRQKSVDDGFSQYPMLVSRKGQKNLSEVRTASILNENSSNTLQHLRYYAESALRRSAANIFPKISTVPGVTGVYILSNFMDEWYVLFAISIKSLLLKPPFPDSQIRSILFLFQSSDQSHFWSNLVADSRQIILHNLADLADRFLSKEFKLAVCKINIVLVLTETIFSRRRYMYSYL